MCNLIWSILSNQHGTVTRMPGRPEIVSLMVCPKNQNVMCYYTLLCTRKQYSATSLHWALLKIKLNYQIHIKHCPVLRRWLQFPAGSWRLSGQGPEQESLYLQFSSFCITSWNIFTEGTWWGNSARGIWAVFLFCCWKTCIGRLLAKIWSKRDSGFLQLRLFGYQFNLPLASHVMAEQQNQKTFCAISWVIATIFSNFT